MPRHHLPDGIDAPTVAAILLLTLFGCCDPNAMAESNSRPNIVLVLADDIHERNDLSKSRPEPLALGSTLTARLEKDGRMTLAVDGRVVAQAQAPGLLTREPGDSIQIGADTIQPVGQYESPNCFTGVIGDLSLEIRSP